MELPHHCPHRLLLQAVDILKNTQGRVNLVVARRPTGSPQVARKTVEKPKVAPKPIRAHSPRDPRVANQLGSSPQTSRRLAGSPVVPEIELERSQTPPREETGDFLSLAWPNVNPKFESNYTNPKPTPPLLYPTKIQ